MNCPNLWWKCISWYSIFTLNVSCITSSEWLLILGFTLLVHFRWTLMRNYTQLCCIYSYIYTNIYIYIYPHKATYVRFSRIAHGIYIYMYILRDIYTHVYGDIYGDIYIYISSNCIIKQPLARRSINAIVYCLERFYLWLYLNWGMCV